jgi:hypothetical protein
MALPILEVPKYTMTIPSTGDVVEYRPFLVKEEKNLMIAQETGEGDVVFNAMKDIIKACTFNVIDPESLATYDLEYVFLQIRCKAVGETADVTIKCSECGKSNPVTLNLTEAYVQKPEEFVSEKTIQVTNDIGIILQPIKVSQIGEIEKDANLTATIKAVLKSIYDADNIYPVEDQTAEELDTFIDSLPHKALEEINSFLTSQPKLVIDVEFKCRHCGEISKSQLTGITDFFG